METNYLQNKKVSIKLVDKYRSGFSKISDGNTIWRGSKRIYQLPTNQYDRLLNVLNDPEEQQFFEERMGLEKGSLSTSARKNNFWREFKVTLDKKGRTLDLTDPEDYLAYKVLLVTPAVANSIDSINVMVHDFYMVTEEEERETGNRIAEKFEEASSLFNKISKSDAKMRSILRLLGKNLAKDADTKWMKSELVKIINQKEIIRGVPNIDDFISVANDPNFEMKIFIMDARELGEIFVEGSTYKLRSGDPMGFDLDQAISFLKDPKNQGTKLLIEERIKGNK